jgi:hypothetical protein
MRKKDIGLLTREIDYNSRSYLKDLKKIQQEANKASEMCKPDYDKMNLRYDI